MLSRPLRDMVCLAVCLVTTVGFAQGPVPVLNAGFEQPDPDRDGMPLGWGTYPGKAVGDRMAFIWDDTVAHSGKRSISIVVSEQASSWLPSQVSQYATTLDQGDLAGLRPSVTVGHEYILSAWVKATGSAGGVVGLVLRWTDANGWVPQMTQEIFQLHSDGWQLLSISAVAPEGAEHICPILQVRGATEPGQVWFDNVRIADRTGMSCELIEPPVLSALPYTWRMGLQIAGPREAAVPLHLSVCRGASGAEPVVKDLGAVQAAGVVEQVAYRASVPHILTYSVLGAGDTLFFHGHIPVDDVLTTEVVSPRYRNTLFGPVAGRPIRVRCRVRATDEVLGKLTLAAALLDGETALAEVKADEPRADQVLELPLPAEVKPEYAVQVSLTAGDQRLGEKTMPIYCRPDVNAIARIGDNNELILDGEPVFPMGFYSPSPEDFPQFGRDGFTIALTYSTDLEACATMAQQAQAAGIKLIASVLRPAVKERDEARVAAAVAALDQYPGMIGYYLWDEPGAGAGVGPEDMRWLYEQAMAVDPRRLTTTVFCQPSLFAAYADTMDVFMVDPYVCFYDTETDMSKVSDWVDEARRATGDRKPVWLVPQAFDHITGPGKYRMPTIEEQRCMTYLGIIHGAKGVIWFTYTGYCVHSAERAEVLNQPFAWVYRGTIPYCYPLRYEGIKKIVAEVTELTPVLLSADPEQVQRVMETAAEVHTLLKRHEGAAYLFTVNTRDRPVEFACELPGLAGEAEVLHESRQVALTDGVLKDSFKPYEVHIYRFGG